MDMATVNVMLINERMQILLMTTNIDIGSHSLYSNY